MTIYLIRHGKTLANERRVYCGSTDLSLSEQGREELADIRYDIQNVRFLTSGMKRANETMELLFPGAAYETDPEFRELDFGVFEMHGYEELKDRVAIVELDAHRKAQATIDEAKAQAEEIRAAARQWVEEVLARYEGMRAAVDGLMESARAVTAMEEQLQQASEQAAVLKEMAD